MSADRENINMGVLTIEPCPFTDIHFAIKRKLERNKQMDFECRENNATIVSVVDGLWIYAGMYRLWKISRSLPSVTNL